MYLSVIYLPIYQKIYPYKVKLSLLTTILSLGTEKLIQILNAKQNHTQENHKENPKPKQSLMLTTQILRLDSLCLVQH